MPPIIINNKNLALAVNDPETAINWFTNNYDINDVFAIPEAADRIEGEYDGDTEGLTLNEALLVPNVWSMVMDEYNNDFIDDMEEEFEDEYNPNALYTIHESDTPDPEDSETGRTSHASNLNDAKEDAKRSTVGYPVYWIIFGPQGNALWAVDSETKEFTRL